MGGKLDIDTSLIAETASGIESEKNRIYSSLEQSQSWMQSLGGKWTGAGGEAVISAYGAFADRYFKAYADALEQYVVFLRDIAGHNYELTEARVKSKADEI